MSELDKRTFTPRRLDLLVPSGWDTDPELESETAVEIETENVVPPNDIMDFLADTDVETEVEATEPAPPTRFAVPLSDEAVKEARKAAVPKTTQ